MKDVVITMSRKIRTKKNYWVLYTIRTDRLGLWIPCHGIQEYWFGNTGFQILCQWNLDSEFQLLVGFQIPLAIFRIPKPRIPESIGKVFLESRFHKQKFSEFRNPDFLTWGDSSRTYSMLMAVSTHGIFLCTFVSYYEIIFIAEYFSFSVCEHNKCWRRTECKEMFYN